MGSTRNVTMSSTADTVKIVDAPEAKAEKEQKAAKKAKAQRQRSKKYTLVRSQVDRTKAYDTFAAIELVKRLSYSKFAGSIEAHVQVKEAGSTAELSFPHSTGKQIKVAIASDDVLAQIKEGTIDFDVLISTAEFMPKLTKHARVLGPKGLMPNPKNGTLTSNPEAKKKALEGGRITLKTEKKAPLIHTLIGKTDMETKNLVENIQALLKALKGKVVRLTISATMSPGVKVKLD